MSERVRAKDERTVALIDHGAVTYRVSVEVASGLYELEILYGGAWVAVDLAVGMNAYDLLQVLGSHLWAERRAGQKEGKRRPQRDELR